MRRGGFLLAAALILLDLAGTVRFVAIATLVISWAVAERTGAMDISRRRHYLFTWLAGCLTAFVMVLGEVGVGDLVFVTILAIFYGTWGGTAAWMIAAGNRGRPVEGKP